MALEYGHASVYGGCNQMPQRMCPPRGRVTEGPVTVPSSMPPLPRPSLLITATVVSMMAIFVVDVTLPQGHDASYAYVLAVLVAGLTRRRTVVVWTAVLSGALTLTAYAIELAHRVGYGEESLVLDRVLALVLIAASAAIVVVDIARERQNDALGRALRAAENDRKTDRRMLSIASEVSPIGTWSMNADDNYFDWSDTAAVLHGQPPGFRPTRDQFLNYLLPDDARRVRKALDLCWAEGAPFREDVRITLPDGAERWVIKMGEAVRDEVGSVARLHGTVQDITQWKHAELSASKYRNRFSQLTDALPIIVWTADANGLIDFFNDAMLRYTGSAEEDLLADQWLSVVDPRDVDMVSQHWSTAVATGEPYDAEFRIKGRGGAYLWHHVSAQPERDPEEHVVRWWGSAINVDAARNLRIRAEELAADREMILESMNDGVYALDEEWHIVYVNKSAEQILHRQKDELVGRALWDLFPGVIDNGVFDAMAQAMEHGASEQLTYYSEALGKWLEFSISRSEMGGTVFFRDVTEIKSMSERLAQSQRLEAVGQLTGGIAHDFNNLLTVVLGGADALSDDDSVSGEAREMATMIADAAERGADLTHRLLAFARRQPLVPLSVDLAGRLRGLEPLLRRAIGEDISMSVDPAEDHSLAEVDPGQYDNAVLNLAINARDAMAQGGSLTIEVETTTIDEVYASAQADVKPGTYVVTTVTDSGEGIARENLDRLFDPFFTSKETGKGSGLGLAMVWGFVKQSNGHVTVYSEPGIGTSFKLYLPAASAPAAPIAEATSIPAPRVGTGQILVAEDDDLVRRFATERLRSRGYDVVEAGSGPEALEALNSMDRLDLLFTDVIMPGGMSGRELADAVIALRPGTPVLYASGYTENVIIHNGRLDHGVQLLAKPYSARRLLDRVGELILHARAEGA